MKAPISLLSSLAKLLVICPKVNKSLVKNCGFMIQNRKYITVRGIEGKRPWVLRRRIWCKAGCTVRKCDAINKAWCAANQCYRYSSSEVRETVKAVFCECSAVNHSRITASMYGWQEEIKRQESMNSLLFAWDAFCCNTCSSGDGFPVWILSHPFTILLIILFIAVGEGLVLSKRLFITGTGTAEVYCLHESSGRLFKVMLGLVAAWPSTLSFCRPYITGLAAGMERSMPLS